MRGKERSLSKTSSKVSFKGGLQATLYTALNQFCVRYMKCCKMYVPTKYPMFWNILLSGSQRYFFISII